MRRESNKQKLLYVAKILYEETDEDHPMTGDQIVERLKEWDIVCERKSVYNDLTTLSVFGMDIIRGRRGAYLATRGFELPELKLLVDAVQSSKFITEKKSNELIARLGMLTSRYEAKKLTSQVSVHNRVKSMNESIYYNIHAIYEGIRENKQIAFLYYTWNTQKELVLRKNGETYIVSPWFFQWDSDKYYLVGYDESTGQMRHYRVDKMREIHVCKEERLGRSEYDTIDVASYGSQTFGMFAGKKTTVKLLADASLAGVMIDHFGKNVWMHEEQSSLSVVIDTVISERFFGWLFGFGNKVKIVEPSWVQEEYVQMIENVWKQYE